MLLLDHVLFRRDSRPTIVGVTSSSSVRAVAAATADAIVPRNVATRAVGTVSLIVMRWLLLLMRRMSSTGLMVLLLLLLIERFSRYGAPNGAGAFQTVVLTETANDSSAP